MNRPRQLSIDSLSLSGMQNKLRDIQACIDGAKDDEAKSRYQEQHDYTTERIAGVLNMSLSEHYPSDLGIDGEGGHLFV